MKIFSRKIFSTACFIILVLFHFAHAAFAEETATSPAELPDFVKNAHSLVPVSVTPEVGFDAAHVQGLVVTDKYYFFTSVFKAGFTANIFKLDRETMELLDQKNLAKMVDFHPGGIDFDGKYIWIPVAVYSPDSHTNMMIVDPKTFKSKRVFQVEDHIGAVACIGDKVIGASWSAKHFYFWTRKGELLEKRESPTGVGYQDCNGEYGHLMCTGGGYLDWINIEEWKLAKRFELGKSKEGSPLSREGVSLYNNHVFFLPDDGPTSSIYEFAFSEDEPTESKSRSED